MKISLAQKIRNVRERADLTMNNLEKNKRPTTSVFFKHSQKFRNIRQMIPPNKTSTGEFQLKMLSPKRKADRQRNNGRCLVLE